MESLLQLMKSRQSTRVPFDPVRKVGRDELLQIVEAGCWAPTAHNMQNYEIVVVDDLALIEQIRKIELPASPTFIQENYLQLSFSEEELQEKGTGVLSTMFPKSWLRPGLIPERPHMHDIGILQWHGGPESCDPQEGAPPEESHNQLLSCPGLILMVYDPERRAPASSGDFLGVMSLGCVLENMWLMAHSLGIHVHVVSALSGEEVQPAIKKILHIPDPMTIALSFRVGYPTKDSGYLRVRRDTESFMHFNRFGRKTAASRD